MTRIHLVLIRGVALLALGAAAFGCGTTTPVPSSAPAVATVSPSASASVPPTASAAPSQPSGEPSLEPSTSPTASAAPSSAVASPSSVAIDLPRTPVEAPLGDAYNTSGGDFDPADLGGLEPGDVTARWYVADDRWVVQYDGLDLEATGALCAGSSIQVPSSSFERVSNAPTGEDGDPCRLFETTRAEPPVGVRLCGNEVLYLTEIPAEAEGLLYASLEATTSDGVFVGITSQADPAGDDAPEIDLVALGCEVVPPGP